jgi:hypothetical protein
VQTLKELLSKGHHGSLKTHKGKRLVDTDIPKYYKAFLSLGALLDERDSALELIPLAREFERRRNHEYHNYEPANHPLRDQLGFHLSTAIIRLVKGGNRSGKSYAAAMDICMVARGEHPSVPEPERDQLIWVISESYRTLQNGIWAHMKQMLPSWDIVSYGAKVPMHDVPSAILVRHKHSKTGVVYTHKVEFISSAGGEQARKRMQSAAVDYISIDEEIDWRTWDELRARIIDRAGRICISATLYRSEPWLTELEEYALSDPDIDCFTLDTEQAMRDGDISEPHFRQLVKGMSKEEIDVRIHGLSRKAHGRVYSNFREKNIMNDREVSKDLRRYCAIDPGHHTAAVLYIAALPAGGYWCYREIYLEKSHWEELAHAMRRAEGWKWNEGRKAWEKTPDTENIYCRIIDVQGFARTMTGDLGAGDLLNQEYGFDCVPSMSGVEFGIDLCRRDLEHEINGKPICRVFGSLTKFQREIMRYKRGSDTADARRHERTSAPIRRNNHLMDCWRYIRMHGITSGEESGMPPEAVQELSGIIGTSSGPMNTEREAIKAAKRSLKGHEIEKQPTHTMGLGDQY